MSYHGPAAPWAEAAPAVLLLPPRMPDEEGGRSRSALVMLSFHGLDPADLMSVAGTTSATLPELAEAVEAAISDAGWQGRKSVRPTHTRFAIQDAAGTRLGTVHLRSDERGIRVHVRVPVLYATMALPVLGLLVGLGGSTWLMHQCHTWLGCLGAYALLSVCLPAGWIGAGLLRTAPRAVARMERLAAWWDVLPQRLARAGVSAR